MVELPLPSSTVMMPAVAESGLARYCDIFTEAHAFDLDQTRRILGRAAELGIGEGDRVSWGGCAVPTEGLATDLNFCPVPAR